jgi:hypothetical protein
VRQLLFEAGDPGGVDGHGGLGRFGFGPI